MDIKTLKYLVHFECLAAAVATLGVTARSNSNKWESNANEAFAKPFTMFLERPLTASLDDKSIAKGGDLRMC